MANIDFRNKIHWRRRYRSPQGVETEREILRVFESDRGRIINSPAIRRLQQKPVSFHLSVTRRSAPDSPIRSKSSRSGATSPKRC